MSGAIDLLFGDGPDTSGINDAARTNAALSGEALAWAKQRYEEEAPARQAAIDMAMKTANQQSDIAQQNADISKDYYDYSKGTFRPLEQGLVTQAQAYDTPERRQAESDAAVADVNQQVSAQRAATGREMARAGVNPESGKALAVQEAGDIGAAKAAAGASYQARKGVELQGWARQMDAANLGRGLASSQATSAGVALNAGNSSVGNAQVPVSIGNQATAGVMGGISQAMQGNASAGSLYGQAGSLDLAKRGQDLNFTSSMINGSGSSSNGSGGSSASGLAAFMPSDENIKSGTGKKINTASALGAILDTPVHEGWQYDPAKGGPDDGGQPHDGPMAQDVQKHMGDKVAPGGKVIDMASMNGVLMAGIQELAKEVKSLKKNKSLQATTGVI
jgi:hypothetical protein